MTYRERNWILYFTETTDMSLVLRRYIKTMTMLGQNMNSENNTVGKFHASNINFYVEISQNGAIFWYKYSPYFLNYWVANTWN
jgi:hypothetical protein